MSPLLVFYMDLRPSSELIQGRLLLINNGELHTTFIATSGGVASQHKDSQDDKGKGPIPSCSSTGLENYWVETTPVNLPHVKGVNGLFYPIKPFNVAINGVQRGDFGIHFDANIPGSAGCVVIRNPEPWGQFQQLMSEFKAQGISRIPLIASYS